MELYFDSYSKDYILFLKGSLKHTVKLGSDIHGNITRINNDLDSFEKELEHNREKLDETRLQMERAREEVDKPFPQAHELKEKIARLNEVNILLNMDEKDKTVLDADGESPGNDPGMDPAEELQIKESLGSIDMSM